MMDVYAGGGSRFDTWQRLTDQTTALTNQIVERLLASVF